MSPTGEHDLRVERLPDCIWVYLDGSILCTDLDGARRLGARLVALCDVVDAEAAVKEDES